MQNEMTKPFNRSLRFLSVGFRTEKTPKEVKFFAKDGRPLNINQGK
jgi:hypothetical protein